MVNANIKRQHHLTDNTNESHFPIAGGAHDGFTKDESATVTCFCGAVQLEVPTEAPGLVNTFVCNCTDCHKITASMFASNFTVLDSHLKRIRGRENLTAFGQSHTIASGKKMTNYFCSTCGTLMYRVGESFPDMSIMRIGTIDDFTLMSTKLRPQKKLFVKDRLSWLRPVEGAQQFEAQSI